MLMFNSENQKSLYNQLYQQLKDNILSGVFKHGTKLPSGRSLTKDFHISRNTIEAAYQQLIFEGYIYCKPKSGYYVENINLSLMPVVTKSGQNELKTEKLQINKTTYNLQYGKITHNDQLFSKWQKLTNDCIRDYKDRLTEYVFIEGEPGLRKEIMKYLQEFRGVQCSLDQIIIGGGTQYSISLICQLLLNKASATAIEKPGLSWAYRIFRNYDFSVWPIGLDNFGLNVDQLKTTDADIVYVTPSHQFPTGKIMPISRRLELVEWAVSHNKLIIEDDYTGHFHYNIKPIPSLQSLCPSHVIYLGTVSKFLFPSMRVSYLVLPECLVARFNKIFIGLPSVVSFLTQKTLELFMQEGNWDNYLRKTITQLRKKHAILIESLNKVFEDTVTVSGTDAGLHILVKVKWPMKTEELIARAAKAGVNISPPSELWFGDEGEIYGEVLLGFGGIEADTIPEAVKALKTAWFS